MTDEVIEKTVALCVNSSKMTARILKDSMVHWLRFIEQNGRNGQNRDVRVYGKQSMKSLQKQNVELTNIEITEKNIKDFERYARKYGISYALKKDRQAEVPRWYVFFKARDVDTVKAAFKEYTQYSLNRDKKPSLRKTLKRMVERAAKQQEREKTKKRERTEAR